MLAIRNADGKLVCRIDVKTREVEIKKGVYITVLRFESNGKVEIINIKSSGFRG